MSSRIDASAFPLSLILGKASRRAERDLARRVNGCKSRYGGAKRTVTLRRAQSLPIAGKRLSLGELHL
jgi:hypothetical protein